MNIFAEVNKFSNLTKDDKELWYSSQEESVPVYELADLLEEMYEDDRLEVGCEYYVYKEKDVYIEHLIDIKEILEGITENFLDEFPHNDYEYRHPLQPITEQEEKDMKKLIADFLKSIDLVNKGLEFIEKRAIEQWHIDYHKFLNR